MGTHSKTAHKSGAITPASAYPSGIADLLDVAETGVWHLVAWHQQHHATGGSQAAWYDLFAAKARKAADALRAAQAAGVDPGEVDSLRGLLMVAVSSAITGLSEEQMIELAALNGFQHPALAAIGGSGPHPLSHWLDPTYPPADPAKLVIQAKALKRYAALCEGETIAGLDLAALHALEGTQETRTGDRERDNSGDGSGPPL